MFINNYISYLSVYLSGKNTNYKIHLLPYTLRVFHNIIINKLKDHLNDKRIIFPLGIKA